MMRNQPFTAVSDCVVPLRRCLALLAIPLMACTDDTPRASTAIVRDSAGVRIVENTSPLWQDGQEWHLGEEPVVDIGGGDTEEDQLFRVRDATRLGDGAIAVADGGSNEIRVFSRTGQHRWTVGRSGDGPGEFRRLSQVARFRGDSLIGFDLSIGRVTVIDRDGIVSRVMSTYSRDVRMREVYALSDSTLIGVVPGGRSAINEGLHRRLQYIVRLAANTGAPIDTVTLYPGSEVFDFSGGGFVGSILPLFGKSSYVAVHQGRVLVGTADSMSYSVFTDSGRLERIVRVPGYDLTLTAAQIERERAPRLAEVADMPQIMRNAVAGLPRPSTRPAYADLVVDSEGFVWVAAYHGFTEPDQPTDWEVFAEQGKWLGTVRMPPRLTVYEIGRDYVLGLWRSDLDVEHVQLYELVKPE